MHLTRPSPNDDRLCHSLSRSLAHLLSDCVNTYSGLIYEAHELSFASIHSVLSVSYLVAQLITWELSCKDLARSLRGWPALSTLLFAGSGFAFSAGLARLLGMLMCLSPADNASASRATCKVRQLLLHIFHGPTCYAYTPLHNLQPIWQCRISGLHSCLSA